jgi:fatty-acyl-CoA synthase
VQLDWVLSGMVFAELDVRPRNVVVLAPESIPKTPFGKLRRAHALSLVV